MPFPAFRELPDRDSEGSASDVLSATILTYGGLFALDRLNRETAREAAKVGLARAGLTAQMLAEVRLPGWTDMLV